MPDSSATAVQKAVPHCRCTTAGALPTAPLLLLLLLSVLAQCSTQWRGSWCWVANLQPAVRRHEGKSQSLNCSNCTGVIAEQVKACSTHNAHLLP